MPDATNLERMIQLAEEFFSMKNDPSQLSITEATMQRLKEIHLSTLSEELDANGPIAWVLVLPTMGNLMHKFIAGEINERELFASTPLKVTYESVYLCSALVLPEYRNKGIAKCLAIRAIESIQKDYPIKALFYWAFSIEGAKLAAMIANKFGLPLYKRVG